MKIVSISDFDSGFSSSKILPKIKKENPDLIIINGDLCYGDKIRKILLDNWELIYLTNRSWFDFVSKADAKKLVLKSLNQGERVIKVLSSLNVPVLVVYGNHEAWDYTEKRDKFYYKKRFDKIINKYKNVYSLEFANKIIQKLNFVGYGNFISGPEYDKKSIKEGLLLRKFIKRYKPLFLKGYKNILVTHNVPYDTKLDIIKNPGNPRDGEHVGSKYVTALVKRFKPDLCISGHMHENQGKIKIGKTICIDTVMGTKGMFASIEFTKDKLKVKLKK